MSNFRKQLSIILVFALAFSTLFSGLGFAAEADQEQVKRIEGPNRYVTAANLALELYPEGADAAVVARGDDFADGLTASVLAGAVDGPVLLTRTNELVEATKDALEELGVSTVYVVGGAGAVSDEVLAEIDALDGVTAERVSGANRHATAKAVAEKTAELGVDFEGFAFVVNGSNYADAMVAGSVAYTGYPILTVRDNGVPQETEEAIEKLGIEEVVVVGGTAAVSNEVAAQLEELDVAVERVAGPNRHVTSADFANKFFGTENVEQLVLVGGSNLADALGAAAFASPILYVDKEGIRAEVEAYITAVAENNPEVVVTALGGTGAIANSVLDKVTQIIEEVVLPEEPADLEVVSVSAITPNSLVVEFNQDVEELTIDRNNVIVKDEDDNRLFVQSVTTEENKANVKLYQTAKDETHYTVELTIDGEVLTAEFTYLEGEVSSIVVSDVTVPSDKNHTIQYKVLTTTGIDVTEFVDATFQTSKGDIVENGVIDKEHLVDGEVIFVEISVGDVKSSQFRIIVKDSVIVSFGNWTIANESATIDWEKELNKTVKHAEEGKRLFVSGIDQYGNEFTIDEQNIEFESLTPNVLIVDTNDGTLTPRAEGTALVRVKSNNLTWTFEVQVLEKAKLDSVQFKRGGNKVDEVKLNVNLTSDEQVNLEVEFLDQYGDAFTFTTGNTQEITFERNGDAITLAGESDKKVTVTPQAAHHTLTVVRQKQGIATIAVKYGDVTLGTIAVEVLTAGETVAYVIEGDRLLDLDYDREGNDNPGTVELEVYPVDANGVKTGEAAEAEWIVKGPNNFDAKYPEEGTSNSVVLYVGDNDGDIELTAVGEYVVQAKVGNLVVDSVTVEVIDTAPPYVVTQTKGQIEIDQVDSLFEALVEIFEVTQNGKDAGVEIDKFSFLTSTASVITAVTDGDKEAVDNAVKSAGVATLYIEKITFENGKSVAVDFQVKVTVAEDEGDDESEDEDDDESEDEDDEE